MLEIGLLFLRAFAPLSPSYSPRHWELRKSSNRARQKKGRVANIQHTPLLQRVLVHH